MFCLRHADRTGGRRLQVPFQSLAPLAGRKSHARSTNKAPAVRFSQVPQLGRSRKCRPKEQAKRARKKPQVVPVVSKVRPDGLISLRSLRAMLAIPIRMLPRPRVCSSLAEIKLAVHPAARMDDQRPSCSMTWYPESSSSRSGTGTEGMGTGVGAGAGGGVGAGSSASSTGATSGNGAATGGARTAWVRRATSSQGRGSWRFAQCTWAEVTPAECNAAVIFWRATLGQLQSSLR